MNRFTILSSEIEDFSRVSCGGTRMKSTAKVRCVTLKRLTVGSGKERIEIKLVSENNNGLV
jgi:Ser-tRNA(Ala) deacylase AlaX